MASLGWKCSVCTYFHHAPGPRCVMCGELRVSRQQIRDWIAGKPIPKESSSGCSRDQGQSRPSQPPRQVAKPTQNPYLAKAKPRTDPTEESVDDSAQRKLDISDRRSPEDVTLEGTTNHENNIHSVRSNVENLNGSLKTVTRETMDSLQKFSHGPLLPHASNTNRSSAFDPPKNSINYPLFKPPQHPTRASPTESSTPYAPGPVPLATHEAREWIFPVDEKYPKRDYQLHISGVAIMHNTLVSLPTGLGKTLIAAVVMYNFYRFFPTGKVMFLAPTLPLVEQQVRACFNIMGIPEINTALLTGRVHAKERTRIWKEKRVFFCTPQTVEKDLDAGRCDPSQFVCVVLDEAHKATGNFSYVKILTILFRSQAKFRVVGLSATPGRETKAIQNIINALRISKIEAKSDSDPSVAKYIHDREVEEIIVKNSSVCTEIENLLTDMLFPHLEMLRQAGGLPSSGGLGTVSTYQLHRAREAYERRTNDKALVGVFAVAYRICELRAAIHTQGIGVVRSKMQNLLSQPQRGQMSTFVKSDGFLAIWAAVQRASCDPNDRKAGAQEKLANKPKLAKLVEILTEHFERDKAVGRSSRCIVFSQFRDTVSEIVSALNPSGPLIRPHHFVGQSKAGKSGDSQVKGMKQSEQHEVIRQFRTDVYNVLVCTCIGEEGLDIGEVDLIVNFDVTKSPIRSIQRTGRTGRKRDGRVVCLVSEGSEEKTLRESKQSEKRLARALQKNNFEMVSGYKLFPSNPLLRETKMAISNGFQGSQVEGHNGSKIRHRSTKSASGKVPGKMIGWKLSEKQRSLVLGVLNVPSQVSSNEEIHSDWMRRFLLGRQSSCSRGKGMRDSRGRASLLLSNFEEKYYSEAIDKRGQSYSERRADGSNCIFPLTHSTSLEPKVDFSAFDSFVDAERQAQMVGQELSTNGVCDKGSKTNDVGKVAMSTTIVSATISEWDQYHTSRITGVSPRRSVPNVDTGKENQRMLGRPIRASQPKTENVNKGTGSTPVLLANPYGGKQSKQRTIAEHPMKMDMGPRVPDERAKELLDFTGASDQRLSKLHGPSRNLNGHSRDLVCGSSASSKPTAERSPSHAVSFANESTMRDSIAIDDFCLPSQSSDDSSASSCDDSVDSGTALKPPPRDCQAGASNDFSLPSPDPTDDSSSSDEEAETHPRWKESSDGSNGTQLAPIPSVGDVSLSTEMYIDPGCQSRRNINRFQDPTTKSGSALNATDRSLFPPRSPTTFDSQVASSHKQRLAAPRGEYGGKKAQLPGNLSCNSSSQLCSGLIDTPDGTVLPRKKTAVGKVTGANLDSQDTVQPHNTNQVAFSLVPTNTPVAQTSDDGASRSVEKLIIEQTTQVCSDVDGTPDERLPHRRNRRATKRVGAILDDSQDSVPHGHHTNEVAFSPALTDTPVGSATGDSASQSVENLTIDNTTQTFVDIAETPDERVLPRRRNPVTKRLGAILDSRDSVRRPWHSNQNELSPALVDTPLAETVDERILAENTVCMVCLSGESLNEDPITLCDGPGRGTVCNVAVHTTCYSIQMNVHSEEEWRCDPCRLRHDENWKGSITCFSCGKGDGALKHVDGNIFNHVRCDTVKQKTSTSTTVRKHPGDEDEYKSVFPRRKKAKCSTLRNFFDEEAECRSDEDMDGDSGENDEIEEIEEEEANLSGFINDSSQLGYSQDELDRVDPEPDEGLLHQDLDNKRRREQQYATPMLNRRMRDSRGRSSMGTPDSATGLGNMNFIRSVLEHHRQGGDAEEIERVYHELDANASPPLDGGERDQSTVQQEPMVVIYNDSDCEHE